MIAKKFDQEKIETPLSSALPSQTFLSVTLYTFAKREIFKTDLGTLRDCKAAGTKKTLLLGLIWPQLQKKMHWKRPHFHKERKSS